MGSRGCGGWADERRLSPHRPHFWSAASTAGTSPSGGVSAGDVREGGRQSGGAFPTAQPEATPPHGHRDTARAEGPGRHEVHRDEPEREQPYVVEAPLRIDGGGHARGDAEDGDADAEAAPHQHGRDGAQPGQHEGPRVRLAEVEGPPLDVRVAHGDGVRVLQSERSEPDPGEQDADEHGRGGPPQRAPPRDLGDDRAAPADAQDAVVADAPAHGQQLDHRDDGRPTERVHAPDDVREDTHGQDHRGPAPVPPLAHRTGEETDEQDGEGQAERVGVLAGQGREQVPPVDGERVVEEERQGDRGHDRGDRWAQPEEAAAGPGADGQADRAEDGAELEGDVVGDDPAADGDEEIGDGEVEGVEGEAVVPARVPPGDVSVAQQASRGTWASRCARPCRPRWSSCW